MSRGAGRPPNAAAKVPYDSKQPLLAFGRSLAMISARERAQRAHDAGGPEGGGGEGVACVLLGRCLVLFAEINYKTKQRVA